jgi:copper homeostasis protein
MTGNSEPVLVEACVDSAGSALLAADAGVGRVELCANLVEGGTTPSAGTIGLALERLSIPCSVMVRPRAGDFHYSPDELRTMERDIDTIKEMGAYGVVFGCLATDGRVDADVTARLLERARPLTATFHRAFDMARDPHEALDVLLGLGVDRVLTSGQRPRVTEALDLVAELVRRGGSDIVIMPGGGIDPHNVRDVVRRTGAREIHAYAGRMFESPMSFHNRSVWMGRPYEPDEYLLNAADPVTFSAIVAAAT